MGWGPGDVGVRVMWGDKGLGVVGQYDVGRCGVGWAGVW